MDTYVEELTNLVIHHHKHLANWLPGKGKLIKVVFP